MTPGAAPMSELRALARAEATGEFICATPALEVHVYLQRGRVAWATASTQPFEFARYLKETVHIDGTAFRQVIDECRRERLPLGETLVQWGLVGWDDVKAALRHQIKLALSALPEEGTGRTMFLERARFTEYNPELTLDIEGLMPAGAPPAPAAHGAASHEDGGRARDGNASQLLETIDGAAWVQVFESGAVVESAPGAVDALVPDSLVAQTIGEDADFVAVRSERGSLVGVRLAEPGRSLWCMLSAQSTFGAAVSALWSLGAVQPHPPPPRGELVQEETAWVLGEGSSPALGEMRLVVERASEVCAVIVTDAAGAPVSGIGRRVGVAQTLETIRRRARVFESPIFAGAPASGAHDPAFSFRSLCTGERACWCFGAEVYAVAEQTLWVLTDRTASQGLGWACLTSLCRGIARLVQPGGAA
jgi:hypothetical protein